MARSPASTAATFLCVFCSQFFEPLSVTPWPPWTPHVLVSRPELHGYICRRLPAIIPSSDARTQRLHPLKPLLVSVAAAQIQVDAGD